MRGHFCLSFLAVVAGVAVVACSTNQTPQPQAPNGMPNAAGLNPEAAISQLAAAACKQATSCNEVGPGRAFDSNDACMDKAKSDATNTVRPENCPHGVNPAKLETCVSAMTSQGCSGITGSMARTAQCAASELCP